MPKGKVSKQKNYISQGQRRNVAKWITKANRKESRELGPLQDDTAFKSLMKKVDNENQKVDNMMRKRKQQERG